MFMKKVMKYLTVIILLALIGLIGFLIWKYNKKTEYIDNKPNDNYDKEPIYLDHVDEFDIKDSNYLERFYERYVAYKKLHSDYSDDKIITYVNIGLDKPFYSDMEEVDMSKKYLIICNKYHNLKKDYVPDLVSLDGYGGGSMEREAASYFKKMVDAAKEEGLALKNVSGYRSYSTQKYLYNNYVSKDGKTKADTYSARPGTSEHQTGLASDINWVSSRFENTEEYKWLINNAHKYGFILRYPKGKTNITGYTYEPWHYRYVGSDVAKYIYEHDITYEEYYATFILK